ncbi:tRNA methyltransferase 1 isoform X2 [Rhynchophorus ferrugineus]|uniref:tRNA methyltransferase 1 isoform X2 n=1 Tax=Rhynchophorus ferrugineus TaxID=354439 RepID=UPI003FCE86BA
MSLVNYINNSYNKMEQEPQHITEGQAKIQTCGKVFYNPVQEFNRDLSICVISAYATKVRQENLLCNKEPNVEIYKAGQKYEGGLNILEALSATGLRSIRYAKEIPGINKIVANDLSVKAVDDINKNIELNNVSHIVSSSHKDAIMLMYEHRKEKQFDVIDLDPYGCPSMFLDSAVQSIKNGGLLLVTATDMAVLAGNTPETCYSKYGAISLKVKSCHEMAVRILLQCIEAHANKYGKYIEPLLSVSADFYIRVFVRIYNGSYKCKYTLSKLSHVYHCTGCDSVILQPLGITKPNEKNDKITKFSLPTYSTIPSKCEHCGNPFHVGGPIWAAPIHSLEFVSDVLNFATRTLGTYKRIEGILSLISEELVDSPLYYVLEKLSGTIKVETPSMTMLRSAILNAGYQVSSSHMHKTAIKTNAPTKVLWDIMRSWEKIHPATQKRIADNKVALAILSKEPEERHSFKVHPEAISKTKEKGLVRFQLNPLPFWGPGSKARAILILRVGQDKRNKSKKNQGKRKREECGEN